MRRLYGVHESCIGECHDEIMIEVQGYRILFTSCCICSDNFEIGKPSFSWKNCLPGNSCKVSLKPIESSVSFHSPATNQGIGEARLLVL